MKKKLFLALLTTLLLLLAATTALAVSPSDYNCPLCGEPCTEWYGYHGGDGTVSVHSPACYICNVFVWGTEFLCTPAEGTATCTFPAVCSVCGSPDWLGSAPDPNAHGDMSIWLYASPTQHYRYCLNCRAEASIEYEDHYGGTATCNERAICEGCGEPYGEYALDNHDWEDWEGFSTSTHIRVCRDCDAEEEAPHTGGDGSCFPICEVCGWYYIDPDGEHRNMCDWFPESDTQHRRYCLDCNTSESNEYEDHYGGTATCSELAICEGCGMSYGELSTEHPWSEWSWISDTELSHICPVCYEEESASHHGGDGSCIPTCEDCKGIYLDNNGEHTGLISWRFSNDTTHFRFCVDCGNGQEYAPHYGGTASCYLLAVCEGCGWEYGEYAEHGEFTQWKPYDENRHYKHCVECGANPIFEDHTGGTATCSIRAICADCGSYYGDIDPDAHEWGDWFPDENGTHFRTCGLNGEHIEFGSCTGDSWFWLNDEYHGAVCDDCGGIQMAEHTGGTATCSQPAICEVCNEPYGKPDSSGLSGHPNPTIEVKPGTCYDEGYYRVTCDHPGCSMPFFEIATPANGQHIYNDWQPLGDGSHISACHYCGEELTVPCTVFTAELFAACPICGEYEGGVLAVMYAHDDDESLPYGTLVIRGGEIAVDGALCAITVAGSYGGQVVELIAPVTVRVPVEASDFRVIDMNGEDVPFTLENGMLTFETATAGLFLLVPAE